MPKRVCPLDNDLLPQIKIHIGEKQVNNGVSSDERMKHVYGKKYILLGLIYFDCIFCTSKMKQILYFASFDSILYYIILALIYIKFSR